MNVEQLYLSNYTSPLSSPALSLAAKVRYGRPQATNSGVRAARFACFGHFAGELATALRALRRGERGKGGREREGGGGPIFETPSKGDLRLNLSRSPLLCLHSPLSRPLKPRSNTVCPCLPFKNSIVFVGLSLSFHLGPPTRRLTRRPLQHFSFSTPNLNAVHDTPTQVVCLSRECMRCEKG